MKSQKGAVPIAVIIIIAVISSLGGTFFGLYLGDGSLLSFGIGFGLVLICLPFIKPGLILLRDFMTRKDNE